ncbi:MAG: hypothetical protein OXE74_07860 [Cyanobacteria bacterium MAG CAR2_bin_4]|nr:hypothetical protein [Cyanobacteria bacterium MAG CAR2_bin_4]
MAASFSLTASPAPAASLSVSVTVAQRGSYAGGGTGAKTVTSPVAGTTTYSVATVNDSSAEANGSMP